MKGLEFKTTKNMLKYAEIQEKSQRENFIAIPTNRKYAEASVELKEIIAEREEEKEREEPDSGIIKEYTKRIRKHKKRENRERIIKSIDKDLDLRDKW